MTILEAPHGGDDYKEALELRKRVLREPLGLTYSKADLEAEAEQTHLVAKIDGKVVGCLSLRITEDGVGVMRQVAVDPAVRRSGVGRGLVKEFESRARELGLKAIELHARLTALEFYNSLGYLAEGEVFTEVTLPHQAMSKRLKAVE